MLICLAHDNDKLASILIARTQQSWSGLCSLSGPEGSGPGIGGRVSEEAQVCVPQ